jgi:hypothetical protein
MSRRILTSLGFALLSSVILTPPVAAGSISGNLSQTGLKEAEGAAAQVDVTCLGEQDRPANADKAGKDDKAKSDKAAQSEQAAKPAKSYNTSAKIPGPYSLNVEVLGDCTLPVHYQGMTASIPVVSQKGTARYDLILTIAEGKLSLRRQ